MKKPFLSFCFLPSAFCLLLCCPGIASQDAYYRYLRGLLAERAGDLTTALSEYQKVIEMDPEALEAYKDIAQIDLRTGHTEAALRAAEKVKALAPNEPSSSIFLGNVYVVRGDLAKAAAAYEEALKIDPNNLTALENLGNYYSTIDSNKALEYFHRYLTLQPDNAEIHFQVGVLRQHGGEITAATASYKKAVELEPDQMAPHLALAELYESQKSTASAIAEYLTCEHLDPRNAALYSRLGHLYYDEKKLDEATSQFQNARTLQPQDASVHYWLARLAEERNQWAEASNEAEKAYRFSRDPQFLPLLAYYLTVQRRVKEAVRWLGKARKIESENSNVTLFLGMAYLDLDKVRQATAALERGVGLFPKDPQLHFQLGVAYDRLGKFDQAMGQFRTVVRLDPQNAAAMNYIGYSYADRGIQLPEAEKWVRQAVALEPKNGAYLDSLGWTLYKEGHLEEATTKLEEAAHETPDPLIYDHLGDAYWAAQQPDKALDVWNKSLALDPHNRAVRKKMEEASARVLRGSDQRKFLKYVEGNFRQIRDLHGLVLVRGRWKDGSLHTQGGIYYLQPDRLRLDIFGPAATPVASIHVEGQRVDFEPESLSGTSQGTAWSELIWLPRFLSGQLLAALDSSAVKVRQEKSLLHYSGESEEAWIDPRRGLLTRWSRPNANGGTDVLVVSSYDLVEGLWLPRELYFENKQQSYRARLEFNQWQINQPETAHVFDAIARTPSLEHPAKP